MLSVSPTTPTSTTDPTPSQLRRSAEYPHVAPSDALAVSGIAALVAAPHAATLLSPLVTSMRVPWLRTVAIAPRTSMFLPLMTAWRFEPLWLSVETSIEIGMYMYPSVHAAW